MDDLQHGEKVDRETLEYWGGNNIGSIAVLGMFVLFLTFQDALVEQEVFSELLFIYLFIYLYIYLWYQELNSEHFTCRQALYHLKDVTNSFGLLFCFLFGSLLSWPQFYKV
jgi:hypothetical protein